jgi:hypothetical protein
LGVNVHHRFLRGENPAAQIMVFFIDNDLFTVAKSICVVTGQ